MQTKEIAIQLSDETFVELEKAARAANKKPEEVAAEIVSKGLSKVEVTAEVKQPFPSVALLKNNFSMPLTTPSAMPLFLPGKPAAANSPAPEKLQRKRDLEAQIRELSLVIDTAPAEKKEEYLLQYAILAAELDSII